MKHAWNIRIPRVYRFLPEKYAHSFLEDGSLRISSFRQFSEHADEERLDTNEGKVHLVSRTPENGGQTIIFDVDYGENAYILCGSMVPSKKLMADFNCDSGIVILDSRSFAQAVAAQIPSFIHGAEGPCSYQFRRIIEKNLGWRDLDIPSEGNRIENINSPNVQKVYEELDSVDAYFLKREHHFHQAEYRFVWLTEEPTSAFIDIKVPEARKYCAPWIGLGDVLAF